MKKNFMSPAEITQIGLLTALLTVAGAIKLPSLLPGLEFQISAPLAVGICFVFGFKRYLIIGILSSMISLALGTHNLFNVAIAMQFRIVVGIIYLLAGQARNKYLVMAIAGPLGTLVARLTLSVVLGKGVWALVATAFPGMVFTFLTAPFMIGLLRRVARVGHLALQG